MDEAKARANAAFTSGKYGLADELYTKALSFLEDIRVPDLPSTANGVTETVNGTDSNDSNSSDCCEDTENAKEKERTRAKAILLANRAATRIRLEQYGFAINDANDALVLDPSYVKSIYRRGTAYFALGDVKNAKKDFRKIARQCPQDADARTKLAQCEKVLREEKFAKAIEDDEAVSLSVPASESIDLEEIVVDESYSGPIVPDTGVIDMEFVRSMMETFRAQKKLHYKYVIILVLQAKKLFDQMPNIVEVPVPTGSKITVCGDVHGQYYDLADGIFKKNGMPSKENPYVFNGDFVDRGSFSVEVILTLLAVKVACPEAIHLTRGNHESQNMNKSMCSFLWFSPFFFSTVLLLFISTGHCVARLTDAVRVFWVCFVVFFLLFSLEYLIRSLRIRGRGESKILS